MCIDVLASYRLTLDLSCHHQQNEILPFLYLLSSIYSINFLVKIISNIKKESFWLNKKKRRRRNILNRAQKFPFFMVSEWNNCQYIMDLWQ